MWLLLRPMKMVTKKIRTRPSSIQWIYECLCMIVDMHSTSTVSKKISNYRNKQQDDQAILSKRNVKQNRICCWRSNALLASLTIGRLILDCASTDQVIGVLVLPKVDNERLRTRSSKALIPTVQATKKNLQRILPIQTKKNSRLLTLAEINAAPQSQDIRKRNRSRT